jgi:hypothetical protein
MWAFRAHCFERGTCHSAAAIQQDGKAARGLLAVGSVNRNREIDAVILRLKLRG